MAMNFAGGKKKSSNGRVEDGLFPARIVQILDLGIQKNEWQGEEKIQHQVRITFEFPTEKVMVDDVERPRWLGKNYTVSNHEKSALFALLKAADPDGSVTNKGRNVKAMLGLPLMVEVGSTGTGNAKIANTSRLMKGMTVAELENEPQFFDMSDASTFDVFEKLPKWIQEIIQGGVEFDETKFYQVMSKEDARGPF